MQDHLYESVYDLIRNFKSGTWVKISANVKLEDDTVKMSNVILFQNFADPIEVVAEKHVESIKDAQTKTIMETLIHECQFLRAQQHLQVRRQSERIEISEKKPNG